MGYEKYIDNVQVVFVDEESYLKCRLDYLNYAKQFVEGEDYLSFTAFIEDRVDNPETDWEIESISELPAPQSNTNTFTFQLDPSGEISEGCIVNINSTPIGIATDYDPIQQIASVSLSSGMYMGADGQILYTTYVPGTEQVDNLNNGWVRTTKVYDVSTDPPDVRERKLKEEEMRKEKEKFDRFDILDFD